MISVVLNEENLNETLIHIWNKIYRVFEQVKLILLRKTKF